MKKIVSPFFLLLFFCSFALVGCSSESFDQVDQKKNNVAGEQEKRAGGETLRIVTSFSPLYSHVSNLIDENDVVSNLVPAGTSVHFWQPKPSDIVAMEQADAIVVNGLGLEAFLENYLESLEEKGVLIVDTSEGINPLMFKGEEEEEDEQHDKHDDEHEDGHHDEHEDDDHNDHHDHEGPDPHVWLDPQNAMIQVDTVAKALSSLDPGQEDAYMARAGNYREQLNILDASFEEQFSSTAVFPFIVFHDAYQYFLQAYDIASSQIGLVQEFHGDNPSQKQIVELISLIKTEGVNTIYREPQFDSSIVKRLEEETGVVSRIIDPIGGEVSKDSYINNMKNLAEQFLN